MIYIITGLVPVLVFLKQVSRAALVFSQFFSRQIPIQNQKLRHQIYVHGLEDLMSLLSIC